MQFPLWHEVGIIVVNNTTVVGEKEERIQRNKSDMLVSKKVNSGYFNNACFEHRARYKWYKMIWVKKKNFIRSVFSDHLLLFSVPANVLYCTLLWTKYIESHFQLCLFYLFFLQHVLIKFRNLSIVSIFILFTYRVLFFHLKWV